MSCIVAVRSDDQVAIGGDRASVVPDAGIIRVIGAPKVFRSGSVLCGSCGSYRVGQVLQAHWPAIPARRTVRTLVAEVVPLWKRLFRDNGLLRLDNGVESMGDDGAILLASRDGLFVVHETFCVVEHAEDYAVIGSGWEVALGALHATGGFEPVARVTTALEAAEAHCTGVRRPFDVLTLP